MNRKKITFRNFQDQELVGYLELPLNQDPQKFVLFAHCFTCTKNIFAAKHISRALSSSGYGVLRFDFTGLGESQGDFEDTNFSGQIEDLVAAGKYLEEHYQAPEILVGHSLGGAAVLLAAAQMSSVRAIATIGAPSTIAHVEELLKEGLDAIDKHGKAQVDIGGRPFYIKKQFLEDIRKHDLKSFLRHLGRALLILHSPQDNIVEIKNAEELYIAARHPKSFVSLDGSDHLLRKEKDSIYAGNIIASWARRYVDIPEKTLPESQSDVVANLGPSGFTTEIKAGKHYFKADEPLKAGGKDYGPTPYQLISAALAACTSMTVQLYARRKQWDLENIETHVNYSREHAEDCEHCQEQKAKLDTFEREITLQGQLDEKQKIRLLEIADKCPVHKSLTSQTRIHTHLKS